MDAILQRIIANNFLELPGLTVNAILPIPEALANEVLIAALKRNRNIKSCRVSIDRENRVSVSLKIHFWPWPLNVKLKIFQEVDFSRSPKVRAFMEKNKMLGKLAAFFKVLPEGIAVYKHQFSLDIGKFMQSPEQKRYLALVQSIQLSTEEGKIIFDITIAS